MQHFIQASVMQADNLVTGDTFQVTGHEKVQLITIESETTLNMLYCEAQAKGQASSLKGIQRSLNGIQNLT